MTVSIQDCRLRTDLEIAPQPHGNGRVWIVRDPLNGKSYKFPEGAYRFLESLSQGLPKVRNVEQAQAAAQLVRQAWSLGLLEGSTATKAKEAPFNPFYVKLGGFDPSRVNPWVDRLLAPLFNPAPLALWIAAMVGALAYLTTHPNQVWNGFFIFAFYEYWLLTLPLLAVALIWHEMGHVAACRRFGGEVREMGILLYLFQPAMYANVSDAWTFPSRAHRVIVSLGGVYFEGALWAAAVWTWILAPSWSAPAQVGFVAAVLLAPRLVINLVPFIRFDGYWVAVDLVGVSNLRPKAMALLLTRLPAYSQWVLRAPVSDRQWWGLLGYAVLSVLTISALLGWVGLLLVGWAMESVGAPEWTASVIAFALLVCFLAYMFRSTARTLSTWCRVEAT